MTTITANHTSAFGAAPNLAARRDALTRMLVRQKAAFLRDGPPSLAERRASLG
jgi:hypothetical protein